MRRWVGVTGAATVVAVVGGSVIAGALSGGPSVGAQSPSPRAVELHRTQRASFVSPLTSKRPIFILAIGSDARPGVCMPVDRCLADSLHLIGVSPRKGQATILGFPRDSYVPIPGFGTAKVNEALYEGGPELVVQTVEELTGIPIHYYLLTSFEGMRGMVNDIGGIEVEVPYDMNDPASGAVLSAGAQRLDGKDALAFSRNRKDTPNGDFSRSENQGLLLRAALDQLHTEFRSDPAALFRWLLAGVRHVESDLAFTDVFNLMVTALTVEPEAVANCVVPGTLGFAGSASIVVLSSAAEDIYRDLAKDGVARC